MQFPYSIFSFFPHFCLHFLTLVLCMDNSLTSQESPGHHTLVLDCLTKTILLSRIATPRTIALFHSEEHFVLAVCIWTSHNFIIYTQFVVYINWSKSALSSSKFKVNLGSNLTWVVSGSPSRKQKTLTGTKKRIANTHEWGNRKASIRDTEIACT